MAKLLVVDDEAPIRMLIAKYAAYSGHEVIEAENGMEAVRLCRTEKPDAVIMDIMMPELDGFSACREIRRFSSVPILVLSARGEEYDKINGFEFGADDYIVKPFSPRELMLRVEAILKRTAPHPGRSAITAQRSLSGRRSGRRCDRPRGYGGRKTGRDVAERIRPSLLYDEKQEYRTLAGKTHLRCVGV